MPAAKHDFPHNIVKRHNLKLLINHVDYFFYNTIQIARIFLYLSDAIKYVCAMRYLWLTVKDTQIDLK